MFDTAPADRAVARDQRVIAAIESAEHDVAAAIERLIHALWDERLMRVHRDYSAFNAQAEVREAATKAAIRCVLTNDWMGDLPRDVIQLWPEEAQ